MREQVPNLAGTSRIYAVFGDPVEQVQTPTLINPLFARHGEDIYAVPFHVTFRTFDATWSVFAAMSNVAGIGVTVPHKVAGARLYTTLTQAAAEVGAVNSIQRRADGTMHGALFDGLGFVRGLGAHRKRLKDAAVLLVGAGGAGRAIAHALIEEGIDRLSVLDVNTAARRMTMDMVNLIAGRQLARPGTRLDGHSVLINASPVGLKASQPFPVDLSALRPEILVADIAALSRETELLAQARALGCATSDGKDMLKAQIALIAGFAAGLPAGTPLGG